MDEDIEKQLDALVAKVAKEKEDEDAQKRDRELRESNFIDDFTAHLETVILPTMKDFKKALLQRVYDSRVENVGTQQKPGARFVFLIEQKFPDTGLMEYGGQVRKPPLPYFELIANVEKQMIDIHTSTMSGGSVQTKSEGPVGISIVTARWVQEHLIRHFHLVLAKDSF